MPKNELPPVPNNEQGGVWKRRAGQIVGGLSVSVLLSGLGVVLLLPDDGNAHKDSNAAPPGIGASPFPDTSPSPTLKPTKRPTFPGLPVGGSNSSISTPDVCDTRNSPTEGSFGKNTGVHTLYATEGHPTVAVVTPDRSDAQQLRFKLPGQDGWAFFDPGETGIVIQTPTDIQVDTSDNRDVWFRGCEEGPDNATVDMTSRVQNVFDNFGFGCVDVVTVTKDGYIVQEVKNGQSYTQAIPSTFFPFSGS